MEERELLELAAKAAGKPKPIDYEEGQGLLFEHGEGYWRPLIDDGDALRLAVNLNLNVFSVRGTAYALESEDFYEFECRVDHKGDAYAATRRAIVMAAAEIGRNME